MSIHSGLLDHMPPTMAGTDSPKKASRPRPHLVAVNRIERPTQLANSPHASAASPEWRQTRGHYIKHLMHCRACYTPIGCRCAVDAGFRATYDSPMEDRPSLLPAWLPRYRPTFSDLKSELCALWVFGILNRETRAGSTDHLLFQTEDGSRSLPCFKRDFGSCSICPRFKPRQDRAPGKTRTDMTRYDGGGLNRGAIQRPAKNRVENDTLCRNQHGCRAL